MRAERDRRAIRREERISRQQEARRRDILAVARGLLTRDGLSHFHMERVAEEGGYSRTSIYRYFSSKEDLVMDLAIESVELRVGLYRRVQAWDARARERAVAFGEVTSMLYPRHVLPEVYAVNAVREACTPDRTERFAEIEREQNEIVLAVAREGVESGDWQLPADLTVEEAMFGVGTMTRGLVRPHRQPAAAGRRPRSATGAAQHGIAVARQPRLATAVDRVGLRRDHAPDLYRAVSRGSPGGTRSARRSPTGEGSEVRRGGFGSRTPVRAERERPRTSPTSTPRPVR